MPFSMSSARIAAFAASRCALRCSVLPIPSACRLPCGVSRSGEACPCVPPSSAVLPVPPGSGEPAAYPGRCPHRFCKSAFPVPQPAFGRRPAASASWICRRSAGLPAFPGRCEIVRVPGTASYIIKYYDFWGTHIKPAGTL